MVFVYGFQAARCRRPLFSTETLGQLASPLADGEVQRQLVDVSDIQATGDSFAALHLGQDQLGLYSLCKHPCIIHTSQADRIPT